MKHRRGTCLFNTGRFMGRKFAYRITACEKLKNDLYFGPIVNMLAFALASMISWHRQYRRPYRRKEYTELFELYSDVTQEMTRQIRVQYEAVGKGESVADHLLDADFVLLMADLENELARRNKLNTRLLEPGNVIITGNPGHKGDNSAKSTDFSASDENEKNTEKDRTHVQVLGILFGILAAVAIIYIAASLTVRGVSDAVTERREAMAANITSPTVPPTPTPEPTPNPDNPENGAILYNKFGNLSITLTVNNNTGKDCFFELVGYSGDSQEFFVRSNSTAVIRAPQGTYTLYLASGLEWKGREEFFGRKTTYYICDEKCRYPSGTEQMITVPSDFSGFTKIKAEEWENKNE